MSPLDEFAQDGTATAAFELPCVADAIKLRKELQSNWQAWIENGLDGTFVVVLVPERISELDELLERVGSWVSNQAFLAIRFRLDGRVYTMQGRGLIRPANGDHDSTS